MIDQGVICIVDDDQQAACCIDPADAPVVREAMRKWAEERKDTWLNLTTRAGGELEMLASHVVGLRTSTRASRARQHVIERDDGNERGELLTEAGYVPGCDAD